MDNFIEKYLNKNNFERFEPLVALFDMDGVLYDSMWNHARSWHESMAHYGIPMTEMDAFRYEGMRGVETIMHITRQHRGQSVSEFVESVLDREVEAALHEAPVEVRDPD